MAISVTKLKNDCLSVVRRVETTGRAISITRRGKVVAKIAPSSVGAKKASLKPWEQLRELGGHLAATPEESVLSDKDIEALR
jgi:prevent-host-death family protein